MTEEEHSVEFIPFKNPTNECKILLTNIEWENSKQELIEYLKRNFQSYGLIHSIYADISRANESVERWFAYITFFSKIIVEKILNDFSSPDKTDFKCSPVKPNKNSKENEFPLALSRCVTLANHYFGFDGWRTEIKYHKLESQTEDEGKTNLMYCTAVRIHFPKFDKIIEGAGIGEVCFQSNNLQVKCREIPRAQKQSRSAAEMNAFAKLLIVIVNGNKIGLEIDTTHVEPFYYESIWENYQSNTQQVDYDLFDEN